jgi:GAF domain-containing protein
MSTYDHSELATILSSLAVSMLTERSLTDSLRGLVRVAARLMPNCSGGSIAMLVDGRPTTVAFTDQVVLELDLVQYDLSEGPCLTAIGGEMIRVAHLAHDERFPHFAVGAADQRIQSTLSTPIRDGSGVIGTLNLYSRTVDGFDGHDEDTALVVVGEAAVVIAGSKLYASAANVRNRLQSDSDEASELAVAEGVLMTLYECSAAQARVLIERAADTTGTRLIDAARRVVESIAGTSSSATPGVLGSGAG